MRTHLYDRLHNFNARIDNKYREGWGSAALYMGGSHKSAGPEHDEAGIVNKIDGYMDRKYNRTS